MYIIYIYTYTRIYYTHIYIFSPLHITYSVRLKILEAPHYAIVSETLVRLHILLYNRLQ